MVTIYKSHHYYNMHDVKVIGPMEGRQGNRI
jgi:hypothetical protein